MYNLLKYEKKLPSGESFPVPVATDWAHNKLGLSDQA